MSEINKNEHRALICQCLNDFKKDDDTVMFSDFVVAALDEIIKTRKTKSARITKASWVRWATEVANEMNITLNFTYNNWHIVENRLRQLENETIITAATPSLGSTSSSQRTSSSARSSKSSLGTLLSEEDKRRILASYHSLDVSNMWKLDSSGRYLENIMKAFCEESNYLHDACSMIMNLEDEHWKDCLVDKESEELEKVFKRQRTQLPEDMRLYLDAIPVSDDIEMLFNHINNQRAHPETQRGLYFLKTALLYSLDLFRTRYLPLTDQNERDILRRVWVIIDWAFDGSHLRIRNERGSTASKIDKNKRRKVANTAAMDKQKHSDIPDLLVFYDRYEFCVAEANKKEYDDTKEKNDSSKLSIMCKQMLLNLSCNSPSLQHDLIVVGLSISRMKLKVRELCNPEGVICVSKITKELHYPVHMLEWRSKMLELCEELWILRMEIEQRFIAVCTTSKGSSVCTLKPCFQTSS